MAEHFHEIIDNVFQESTILRSFGLVRVSTRPIAAAAFLKNMLFESTKQNGLVWPAGHVRLVKLMRAEVMDVIAPTANRYNTAIIAQTFASTYPTLGISLLT